MKARHGFWLIVAWLGLWTSESAACLLVPGVCGRAPAIVWLVLWVVALAFPFAALYVAVSGRIQRSHRLLLLLTALAMVWESWLPWVMRLLRPIAPQLLWTLEHWMSSRPGPGDFSSGWQYVALTSSGVVVVTAIVLGFAETERLAHRFLIVVVAFGLGAFLWGGVLAVEALGLIVLILLTLLVVLAFFEGLFEGVGKMAQEDAQRLREGKPPKYGPPPPLP